jgi:membrane associated rhomboid family serine protease
MGYQDRDYYREDNVESGHLFQSWTVRLIVINVVVFLACALTARGGNYPLTSFLALSGDTISQPWTWWRLITAGFVHNSEAPWHILTNMIGLYFFGRPMEERYGSREFVRFYFVAIVLGNLLWTARQYFLVGPLTPDGRWAHALGASGGVTALIVLVCLLYPRQTIFMNFIFPVPAWLAGVLIIAGDLTGTAWLPDHRVEHIAFDIHLAGAFLALSYWGMGLNFGRLPGMRELRAGWEKLAGLFRARPAMRVHRQDDDEEDWDDELEAEADRLLAKIARQGESSLTPRERRVLENYSRRMRQKRR